MFLVSGCNTQSQKEENNTIKYQNIEKHIAELASDKYKGRAPMTESEPLVLDYLEDQMKEIGLEEPIMVTIFRMFQF